MKRAERIRLNNEILDGLAELGIVNIIPDPDFPRYLGDNVRMFRKRKHMTQTELAEYCGIKPSMVSQIESNGKIPNFLLGMKIAKLLGVSAEELVSGRKN